MSGQQEQWDGLEHSGQPDPLDATLIMAQPPARAGERGNGHAYGPTGAGRSRTVAPDAYLAGGSGDGPPPRTRSVFDPVSRSDRGRSVFDPGPAPAPATGNGGPGQHVPGAAAPGAPAEPAVVSDEAADEAPAGTIAEPAVPGGSLPAAEAAPAAPVQDDSD